MKLLKLSCFCLLNVVLLVSCVKQAYDSPPDSSHFDPQTPVNANLRQLVSSALELQIGKSRILGDTTVYGIVIGDDRSGNIYKQIIIQDSSGAGIVLMLDKTYLYGEYPVGRKVYVKLKGLTLMNFKGLPEVAYSVDSTGNSTGIPSMLINDYIVKASFPNTVVPKLVTIADLFSNPTYYLNTLIKLENMEFDASSANVLYSSPNSSTTRSIKDCPFSGTISMYNSSYATFQSATTPSGKGSIIGIFSIYNTPQFLLRDTTDVSMSDPRTCP